MYKQVQQKNHERERNTIENTYSKGLITDSRSHKTVANLVYDSGGFFIATISLRVALF